MVVVRVLLFYMTSMRQNYKCSKKVRAILFYLPQVWAKNYKCSKNLEKES